MEVGKEQEKRIKGHGSRMTSSRFARKGHDRLSGKYQVIPHYASCIISKKRIPVQPFKRIKENTVASFYIKSSNLRDRKLLRKMTDDDDPPPFSFIGIGTLCFGSFS
ncbi:hypothetical protein FisN_19Lu014 [Fistulifera solaris]|uniref:Uncharacterized protein n=1 Tax=Fistulifera solaris TaxID=1519565 RepID=A0A1Z5JRB5_FISSO|nr:hypothetical protein FisN_19Lu014 [Fistulifera solaris]|eukprot:GAX16436.1 hypothetical protein FisN_19Lu014 [Fistulifera solaris]